VDKEGLLEAVNIMFQIVSKLLAKSETKGGDEAAAGCCSR